MFSFFKAKSEPESVSPNGYYEGEILSADYPVGDSDEFHDVYPHGTGKLTVTLEDGSTEIYEGSWDIGRFHGTGRLTLRAVDGSEQITEGEWVEGNFSG